jgi:hypothetical protein
VGREIKRVALDFDHPHGEVWSGYVMSDDLYGPMCVACDGTGESPAWKWVLHFAYGMVAVTKDVLVQEQGGQIPWRLQNEADPPTRFRVAKTLARGAGHNNWEGELMRADPTWVEFVDGLYTPPRPRMVHDYSGEAFGLAFALVKAAGLDDTQWWKCRVCPEASGHMDTPEQTAARAAWEPSDPPEGEGWQLWSTTTEGHPISPVFDTAEGLANWMSRNPCGFAGATYEYDMALRWITGPGWSPSAIDTPGGVVDGITAMSTTGPGDGS